MKFMFYVTGASEAFPAMFCDCQWCSAARNLGGKNIRTRSSCQVDDDLLIDFSADSYMHSVCGGLDMRKIRSILFTHSHGDHFYMQDLLTIRPPMAWREDRFVLQLYGTEGCAQGFNQAVGNRDVKQDLHFQTLELWKTVTIGDYEVTPLKAKHDAKETCFIYVIAREGKTLLYGHDSAFFEEDTWKALRNDHFNCVVLDCTSIMEPHAFNHHMGFEDNVAVKKRMLGEGMVNDQTTFISTHFAHTYGPLQARLEELFAKDGFIPAWDGMEVTF